MNPLKKYQLDLALPTFQPDHSQQVAIKALTGLHTQLMSKKNSGLFGFLTKPKLVAKGIYLWGDVGSGKTYLSCLQSLSEIKNNENIKKIVLVKSVTTLKSEEIGFLKGTMEEKMEPFMYSFVGNFEKIIGRETYNKLKEANYIEILPIAYLRGVNIDNAIVIIDETQNISIDNIRTILTRLGENSKMVFLGDVKQIDAKNKYDSALGFLLTNFNNVDKIGVIEFNKGDIIRHPLIKVIEDIFDSIEESKKPEQPKQLKPHRPKSQTIKEEGLFEKFLRLFK